MTTLTNRYGLPRAYERAITETQRTAQPKTISVTESDLNRFMEKVEVTDSCWVWKGARDRNGYGHFGIGSRSNNTRRSFLAHRWLWLVSNGVDCRELDHVCRNKSCVNPAHLEAVTHRENMVRAIGFNRIGEPNRAKTHCPRGHAYSGINLYLHAGKRHCRACRALVDARRRR